MDTRSARSTAYSCESAQEDFRDYVEGNVSINEGRALQAHLTSCAACRQALAEYKRMFSLMDGTIGAGQLSESFDRGAEERLKRIPEGTPLPSRTGKSSTRMPRAAGPDAATGDQHAVYSEREEAAAAVTASGGALERLGGLPWWGVSVVLHVLIIVLLGLITMTIGVKEDEHQLIVVTSLEKSTLQKLPEAEKKPAEMRDVFKAEKETPATDPNSTMQSNIVVPPDILAMAELGDHFETINLDRPDTHSAFGNPEARMFHSVSGNDEPEGGGGMGGTSLLDDLIGVGGSSSPGTGGGWGGGNGTGIGIGNGSGRGSFGQRNGGGRKLMVMRHGGSKITESAVDKGLEWLARHQEPDGRWDAWKYEAKQDGRTQGVNGDAAVTGFALLAFLGAGHTERIGKYKDNVKRASEWLVGQLKGTRWCTNHGSNYTQGVAALALAEAAGMGRNPVVKEAAQRAVDGVVEGQIKLGDSEYVAWDYAPKGSTNDTSVTGWNVMALKSAKVAGLHVDPAAFEGAMRWINAGQDLTGAPGPGEAEYWEGGLMTYRGTLQNPVGRKNMAMTAAAALTRLLVGGEKPDRAGIAGPCNLMKKPENLPSGNKNTYNLYYWYYGTLAMFQKGGDHWKTWNDAMKPALLDGQRKDGDMDGSWDPYFTEPTGYIYGGRVQSTALGALSLEVYYRYLPLYRE